MDSDLNTRHLIVKLLSNMASSKEIQQYLKRFSHVESARFAVIKVGGAVIKDTLKPLASALSFLHRVGLVPIVVHGAGPQIDAGLTEAGVTSTKIDGLRVTTPEVFAVVRRVFQRVNLELVAALREMNANATSITSGVFEVEWRDRERLGLVGSVNNVHLDAVKAAVHTRSIPVIASLGETADGQMLNLNGDVCANELVRAVEPFKIIFLTGTGGLLDGNGEIIPSINLSTDYADLMAQPWLHSGMAFKLEQIDALLRSLPLTSSVSITTPTHLARELFTHRGSGTLVRLGEHINTYENWDALDTARLKRLLEDGFQRELAPDYFATTIPDRIYVTESYSAAAILTRENDILHLDKFVVSAETAGQGLGRALWQRMLPDSPQLFWRARLDNPINEFYYEEADGCLRDDTWRFFWRGIDDFALLSTCVAAGKARPATV
ncbi:MAG: acetylglutamate kinase [Pseudomonadota bacterium]